MGKSIEDMYGDLLDMENIEHFLGVQSDTEDDEVFMTSKELAKMKQDKKDEVFGRKPATKADIDEELHFTSYRKKHVHKYTDKEMEEIRKQCEQSIVHDYGEHDIFHMTDEERAENDILAELSMKLGLLVKTYRRVDQYVYAMRTVVQAWKLLEQKANFIHNPDEFFKLVGEGRIVSNRILMPKLKRMDDYNVDQLIKYISNPDLDPVDLIHDEKTTGTYDPDSDFIEDRPEYQELFEEFMNTKVTDEMREEMDDYDIRLEADKYAREQLEEDDAMRLLSGEEAEYIVENIDNPPAVDVKDIPRRFTKDYDTRNTFTKKRRKLKKSDRMIQRDVHDIFMKIQNNPVNRDLDESNQSYLITSGMFDVDKEKKDSWDNLFFDGSWADDNQVYLYNLACAEELLSERVPGNRYKTFGDVALDQFFKSAEQNGINVIELRRLMNMEETGTASKAEVKEKIKEDKKLESRILQRLEKLNNDDKFKKLVEKSEKALNKYYAKD